MGLLIYMSELSHVLALPSSNSVGLLKGLQRRSVKFTLISLEIAQISLFKRPVIHCYKKIFRFPVGNNYSRPKSVLHMSCGDTGHILHLFWPIYFEFYTYKTGIGTESIASCMFYTRKCPLFH